MRHLSPRLLMRALHWHKPTSAHTHPHNLNTFTKGNSACETRTTKYPNSYAITTTQRKHHTQTHTHSAYTSTYSPIRERTHTNKQNRQTTRARRLNWSRRRDLLFGRRGDLATPSKLVWSAMRWSHVCLVVYLSSCAQSNLRRTHHTIGQASTTEKIQHTHKKNFGVSIACARPALASSTTIHVSVALRLLWWANWGWDHCCFCCCCYAVCVASQ